MWKEETSWIKNVKQWIETGETVDNQQINESRRMSKNLITSIR